MMGTDYCHGCKSLDHASQGCDEGKDPDKGCYGYHPTPDRVREITVEMCEKEMWIKKWMRTL